jgi:hypothetical protein
MAVHSWSVSKARLLHERPQKIELLRDMDNLESRMPKEERFEMANLRRELDLEP